MARQKGERPTDRELEVLRVFWRLGTATVRDVHRALLQTRTVDRSAVAHLVTQLTDRKLLEPVGADRPQSYKATQSPRRTFNSIVKDLALKMLGKADADLVEHLIDPSDHMSAAEWQALMADVKNKKAKPVDKKK